MSSKQDALPELDHVPKPAAPTDSRHLVEIKQSPKKGVGALAKAEIS